MRDVMDFLKAVGVENISSYPKEKLAEVIAWIDTTATEREKKIVKAYYGLGEDARTFNEIGKHFDVTSGRIKMICNKAIRKLRRSHALRVKHWRNGCLPPQED
jgi:RNA polymerase primary sigma factor